MALNISPAHSQEFVFVQLSFSTADIEKTMFFDQETAIPAAGEATAPTSILVVHGEMFSVEEGDFPGPAARLKPSSGLFKIAGLEKEAAH